MIKQIANFTRQASPFEELNETQLDIIRKQAKTTRLDEWLSDHPKLLKVLIAILEVALVLSFLKRGGRIAVSLLLAAAKALQDRNSNSFINN